MKKILFLLCLLQAVLAQSQVHLAADTVKAPATYENVFVRPLASDSLSSSFIIFIKKEVKKHKHALHTENVLVLEGEGEMLLGKETFRVKKGDWIFIPKNTAHAVKVHSKKPMKVLSIQSPGFDGKDRIMIAE